MPPVHRTRQPSFAARPLDVKAFCVVMPARNECRTVGPLVASIRQLYGCEVVVVDDASTDHTARAALDAGALVLRLGQRAGAWCAVQTGFRHALALGFDMAVTVDADGQHLPWTIGPVLHPVAHNLADVSIGSCPRRAGPVKKAAWAVLRRLAGCAVQDVTSGLRAYNRPAMQALLAPAAMDLDYQDVGVLLLLGRAGLVCREVPVAMSRRGHGRSRQFETIAEMAAHVLKSCLLCVRFGRLGLLFGLGPQRAASPAGERRRAIQQLALEAPLRPNPATPGSPGAEG